MKKLSLLFIVSLLALCACGNDGCLPGKFAVAEGKYVRFSQGNLQYQASTDTWRFAEHQWDFVGDNEEGNVYEGGVKCENGNISSTYSGWIDLFGWGTSGWNSGAKAYKPWEASDNYKDYYPGGDHTNDLTGEYASADWGVFNKIGNGGNKSGLWRTLTVEEWEYLFEHHFHGQATVNHVHGYVLLPEGWSAPSGILFSENSDSWLINDYSAEQWSKMESAGAVFLPCAGFRLGLGMLYVGQNGFYWSASHSNEGGAYDMGFNEDSAGADGWDGRINGQSVRLVQDFN